ncbi:MAG: NifB/NifX family molybdenum-iron cluster-binding protein [Planctomycetes bacterium]|nr:NifB/NifX family molybdenum-iron cluster-binding protein [Planctomycetota bacterium]
MRIALTVWEGRISPVFDVSRHAILVDVRDGRAGGRRNEAFARFDPAGRAGELSRWQVETLICGAISRPFAAALAGEGIRVVPFVAGDIEEVIEAYFAGTVSSTRLAMPGCCGRRRRFRGGGCGRGPQGWRSRRRGG